jgi:hypothetical protein
VGFEQAALKVEREKEFNELKSSIAGLFAADRAEQFLNRMQKKGIRIRDFDLMLASGVPEQVSDALEKQGARKLYESLPLSDQSQIREFYLSKVEEVDAALRTKFHKLYQYY